MKTCLTVLASIAFSFFLSSCCGDDKHCPAGDVKNFPAFPYSPGESITFRDSSGHNIIVTLSNTYTTSNAETQTGICPGSLRTLRDCYSAVELVGTVYDPSNVLLSRQEQFAVQQSRPEEGSSKPVNLLLDAFFSANFSIANYQTETPDFSLLGTPLASYQTPYKTYTHVWTNTQPAPGQSSIIRKFVWTPKGRLLSFTLNNDTTTVFCVVE